MGKTRTPRPVPTYSRVVPGASRRVLVVDDNKVIRQLIRVNLELEGLEVVTAADGVECLDVVHQVLPDVITLDVVMPRLDGLRTAARLRSDPRTEHLPIVIVSACSQYEVEAGLDVGVDAFLAKPFEPAELVQLVTELASRARSARVDGDCGEEGTEVLPGVGSVGVAGSVSVSVPARAHVAMPAQPIVPAHPIVPAPGAGTRPGPRPTPSTRPTPGTRPGPGTDSGAAAVPPGQ